MNVENLTDASEQSHAEETNVKNYQVSPVLLEEKIRATLEPLNVQISNLTQVLNQLIHDNKTITGSSHVHCQHTGSSLDMETGVARSSSDRRRKKFCLVSSKTHF